jgi:2-polyprenyl-3-methyl-5-hydroxy-6-metoxy-1,4-benzoquinol methylase
MDLELARARLVDAFRGDQAPTSQIAVAAVDVLSRSWPRTWDELARDELLSELLQHFPIFGPSMERRLAWARRELLLHPREGTETLLAALAIQGHLNEYAWAVDGVEQFFVDGLVRRIGELSAVEAITLGSYVPLASVPGADALLDRGWTGPVQEVLREQIVAPREEAVIAAGLPSLTPIRSGVSSDVQAQYEANPYPRWRRAGRGPVRTHLMGRPLPQNLQVLIAGCGTGRQAIESALVLPDSTHLAVDLSRASLAYAARKTREMGLDHRITYAQADLLELAETGRTFDLVQASGVLHHLADPFEGARAVARMVKPGGFLAVGLYSARARARLQPAKALGKTYTPQTVRAFRQAILNAPQGDPVGIPAFYARDFYSTSGCRDLLMHVQEHELGPRDLRRMLDETGLEFLGFELRDEVAASYRAMFPHDPGGLDLEAWDRFEDLHPTTFASMYQFTAQKPVA